MENNKISPDEIANRDELHLDNYLECPIDNMVSVNPIMCKKCETIFCPDCIEDWKKRSNVCPMRCSPMELIKTDKTIIRQQINKIKLFCPYEKYGCFEKVLFNEVTRHERICEYRPVECDKCKEKVSLITYIDHLYVGCKDRMIKCSLCEIELNFSELVGHMASSAKTLCQNCCDIDNVHKCQFEIKLCEHCNLPDFANNIINNIHKCAQDRNYTTYIRNLLLKYESFVSTKAYLVKFDAFKKNLDNIYNDIVKKLADKEKALESKVRDLKDKAVNKTNHMKKDICEAIDKIKNENLELKKYLDSNI
jgi:hypothetical protein